LTLTRGAIMAKRSKNDITIEQLNTACRHFYELIDLEVTENIAIRQPLKMVDIYAKMRVIGKCSVDKANEFDYWSIEAEKVWKQAQLKDPKAKYGSFVRIEHGTPRTQFTKIVLEKYDQNKTLTIKTMEDLIRNKWKVAVITKEEDARINANGDRRNPENKSPEKRWADAGIKFPAGKKPNEISNPDKRASDPY